MPDAGLRWNGGWDGAGITACVGMTRWGLRCQMPACAGMTIKNQAGMTVKESGRCHPTGRDSGLRWNDGVVVTMPDSGLRWNDGKKSGMGYNYGGGPTPAAVDDIL